MLIRKELIASSKGSSSSTHKQLCFPPDPGHLSLQTMSSLKVRTVAVTCLTSSSPLPHLLPPSP